MVGMSVPVPNEWNRGLWKFLPCCSVTSWLTVQNSLIESPHQKNAWHRLGSVGKSGSVRGSIWNVLVVTALCLTKSFSIKPNTFGGGNVSSVENILIRSSGRIANTKKRFKKIAVRKRQKWGIGNTHFHMEILNLWCADILTLCRGRQWRDHLKISEN